MLLIHVASTLHSLVEGAELQRLMLWELGLAQRGGRDEQVGEHNPL